MPTVSELRAEAPTTAPASTAAVPVQDKEPARLQPPEANTLPRIGRVLLAVPKSCWVALDILIIISGLHLGYWMFRWCGWENWEQIKLWQAALVLCPTVMLTGLVLGLHERETLANRSYIIARALLTITLSVGLSYAMIYMVMYDTWSRRNALCALGWYATLAIAIRLFAGYAIRAYHCGLLFIGAGKDQDYVASLVGEPGFAGKYSIRGFIETDHHDAAAAADLPADLERYVDICRRKNVREIVVLSGQLRRRDVMRRALKCLRLGCRVTDEVTFIEKTLHRVPVDRIGSDWFLFADLQMYRQEQATLKRLIDVLVSIVGLALSLPLLPLVAVTIKLNSRGPVFYSQYRVGLNGSLFRLYKLRTMTTDAEPDHVLWSGKGDQRVTGVGRLLRKTRLDEMPQLWNILRGQMSMVGPRPERPEFVEQLSRIIPFYSQRHLIKPGLTGWAQTNYGYGSCIEDAVRKLEYDLYYMKHMSVELDLVILLRTTWTFLNTAI